MKIEFKKILNVFIAASIASCPANSLADPGKNNARHTTESASGNIKKANFAKENDERADGIMFDSYDQAVIREYLSKEYKKNCPPGLAKKGNGCLPPGQAKKYIIGQPLQVAWQNLPQDLVAMMGSVPSGYKYVMVDRDVLLISEASKKVIDAVTLLSALKK
jgi:hypothetical protein